MRFGRFRIDRERLVLRYDDQTLSLPPKSVELLAELVQRSGATISKRDLLDRLWPDSAVEEANLSQHVYLIRKTLAACDRAARDVIVTVPKRGYRFVADVLPVSPVSPVAPLTAVFGPPVPARAGFARIAGGRLGRLIAALAAAVAICAFTGSGAQRDWAAPPALSVEGSASARLGRYYLDLRTATGIARSRSYFGRVIASDPRNPAGYAGLADAFAMTADYGFGSLPKMTYLERARRLARRALKLDPQSAAAHASLGVIAGYSHDAAGAMRELRRAIALDPGYAPAHHWLGTTLFEAGDYAASMRELTLAAQLNPVATASNAWLAEAAYFEHQYDAAIEHGRRAVELDPARGDSLRDLGLAYAAKGEYSNALATFRLIPQSSALGPLVPLLLAGVYARAGQPKLAMGIVERERRRHVVNSELPFTLLALGQTRAAARAAAQVRPRDCGEQRQFVGDPRFDAVRGTAAFGSVFAGACFASS